MPGLQAAPETILALATGLTSYGPADGSTDWFIPFAWLVTDDRAYVATPTTEGLRVEPLNQFIDRLRSDTKRISEERGAAGLPPVPETLSPPSTLRSWDGEIQSVQEIRGGAAGIGLLFKGGGARLLLAGDPSGHGLIVTEDADTVADLLADADRIDLAQDLRRTVRP